MERRTLGDVGVMNNLWKVIWSVLKGKVNLFEAILGSNLADICLAHEYGQNLNFFRSENAFMFPLCLAVDLRKYEVVQVMLEYGSDPNFEISPIGRVGLYALVYDPNGDFFTNKHISRLLHSSIENFSLTCKVKSNMVPNVSPKDWILTPTVLSLLMGDEYLLSLLVHFGGQIRGYYNRDLISFLFSNPIVMKGGICRILLNNGDVCPKDHLDHHLFSEVASHTYTRLITGQKTPDHSLLTDFMDCLTSFIDYGFAYVKNDLQKFQDSIKILTLLIESRKQYETEHQGKFNVVRKKKTKYESMYEIYKKKKKKGPNKCQRKRKEKNYNAISSSDEEIGWRVYHTELFSDKESKKLERNDKKQPKIRQSRKNKNENDAKSNQRKRKLSLEHHLRIEVLKKSTNKEKSTTSAPSSSSPSSIEKNSSKKSRKEKSPQEKEKKKKKKKKKDENYWDSVVLFSDPETTDVVGISSSDNSANSTKCNSPVNKTRRGRSLSINSVISEDEIWSGPNDRTNGNGIKRYILPPGSGEVYIPNEKKKKSKGLNNQRRKKKGSEV